MKTRAIPVFFLILLLGACVPVTINITGPRAEALPLAETAVTQLPDLVITSSLISMVDINGNCLGGYELTAVLMNLGGAPAMDVVVEELMSGHLIYVGALQPQQSMALQFPGTANGRYRVMADPQNTIVESDESNNIVSPPGMAATPPAYCFPYLIYTPTTTPYP